jgi:hypothetical protein
MNTFLKFAVCVWVGLLICAGIPDGPKSVFPPVTTEAIAQGVGQLQAGQLWGNPTSSQNFGEPTDVGHLIDQTYVCTAQGSIIDRGASLWGCLGPGTSGLPLVSQGAGANLHYAALANAALTNSSVTLGSTSVSLGATVTTFAGIILTTPTINGASLTGTLSGTPIYSGANFITLANIVQDSTAWSFLGNPTSGTANYAPFTPGSLTAKASPVSGDLVIIADSAASGALKQTTVGAIGSAGSVASVNGQTGAVTVQIQPQGRLTLTSGVPITTTDVTGATTVYYTPDIGVQIPIYDGTANMVPTTFAEISQATTDTTKSPAAVAANSVYDVFVWNDSGTIRATRGPAWSSDTSRGTGAGTSQVQQIQGIFTNQFAITNGPAANRGTLVGSIRSNASAQIVDSKAFRWVSNGYQCVMRQMAIVESTTSWNYTSATFRQANANTADQLDMLQTLGGNQLTANVSATYSNTSTSTFGTVGIDIDSINTTSVINNIANLQYVTVANALVASSAFFNGYTGLGRHIAIWKEESVATGTGTFYGTAGGTILQSGIYGQICN